MFDDKIHFNGTYRPYQKRTLDNLDNFLDNDKIHIVAAPGSGKTILGLELILKLNNASLVLTPSITIREQWILRFKENFANDVDADKYISNDLMNFKPITCITYQALYSAFKKIKDVVEDEDKCIEEEKDYSSFNLFEFLDNNNIKTICLDECHHLRSEWWKIIETTIAHIQGVKIISLTATPPYDSSSNEWQRYIDLCGPIDDEIFVPELIKDHNLCPHQDFIYYSMPCKNEEKEILKYYSYGKKIFYKYKNDKELLEIIKQNKIYTNKKELKKALYRNAPYYQALIAYLNENDVKLDMVIKLLTDVKPLTIKQFEILMQNVLFDDVNSYPNDKKLLSMKKEFASLGVTNKRKVNLSHDERIDKILGGSISKLNSISEIIRYEKASLKENLRCLILSDYIKIKAKQYINNLNNEINSFGAVPIFEHLRRENIKGITLCLLTGSICIVPKNVIDIAPDFEYDQLNDTDYVELIIKPSNRKKIVSFITSLFQEGIINVVVGTKSLLGEGWDSPCINTLIMASFIGSYVISNQTRGRAIRINKNDPSKVSNIWHLICLNPYDIEFNEDFNTVKKRFSSFVGVSYDGETIENGIERLKISTVPRTTLDMQLENNRMQKEAIDREKTTSNWEDCINNALSVEQFVKITYISAKRIKKSSSFFIALASSVLYGVLMVFLYQLFNNVNREFNLFNQTIDNILLFILLSLVFLQLLSNVLRMLIQLTKRLHLKYIGMAVKKALINKGIIKSNKIKVVAFHENLNTLGIYLKNASTYEQNIFSDCISQMLDVVYQPRYLICRPRNILRREFFIVPDIFKKNKESVHIFSKAMNFYFGKFQTIFAKSENGKTIVIYIQFIDRHLFKDCKIYTKQVLLKKNLQNK